MKHTRAVDQKYRLLREEARYRMWEGKRQMQAVYEAEIDDLVKQRQAEIDALPDSPERVRSDPHREDRTQRYCATCGGAFLLATVRNAKLLQRVIHLRRTDTDSEEGWHYKLAALRHPRKKYCCYPCQVGREDGHNAPCCLLSELEADLKYYEVVEGIEVDREAAVAETVSKLGGGDQAGEPPAHAG
jgi:hypothetical protein